VCDHADINVVVCTGFDVELFARETRDGNATARDLSQLLLTFQNYYCD
jgi:hypothetical protein